MYIKVVRDPEEKPANFRGLEDILQTYDIRPDFQK